MPATTLGDIPLLPNGQPDFALLERQANERLAHGGATKRLYELARRKEKRAKDNALAARIGGRKNRYEDYAPEDRTVPKYVPPPPPPPKKVEKKKRVQKPKKTKPKLSQAECVGKVWVEGYCRAPPRKKK